MQFILATIAFAATVLGSPAVEKRAPCAPATYSCLNDQSGWQVCDTSGAWQFAGTCPPHTVCYFLPANQSPYCVPPGYQF